MCCIYCGRIADTREYIPSKLFLRRPFPDNLFKLPACKKCNNGFFKELSEANISRKQRTTAYNNAELAYKEYLKTKVFTVDKRVKMIILKLAFEHAVFELNEGAAAWKDNMTVIKTEMNYRFEMSDKDYTSFMILSSQI